jgi:hypothetical protein
MILGKLMNYINLIKINVGSTNVDDIRDWQLSNREKWPDKRPRHITRMWPKRQIEILNGGSIFWVVKGYIMARQKIIGMEEFYRNDTIKCCALVFDNSIFETEIVKKRPFQGWRYLEKEQSPADLVKKDHNNDNIPLQLLAQLSDIGVR